MNGIQGGCVMKTRFMVVILAALVIGGAGCAKGDKFAPAEMSSRKAVSEEKSSEKEGADVTQDQHFLVLNDKSKDRYLEYRASLAYRTGEFRESRRKLYDIVSGHGFMSRASTSLMGDRPVLIVTFRAPREQLYDLLVKCDGLGVLKSESITVTDHTGQVFYNSLKKKRADARIALKRDALKRAGKNWQKVQDSMENSENLADSTRFKKWKVDDAVDWSTVTVTVTGSHQSPVPEEINVPSFRNALVTALNLVLQVLYLFVVLLPLIVIGIVIYRYREPVKSFLGTIFRKRKK